MSLHPPLIKCTCQEDPGACLIVHGQWFVARTGAEYEYPCRCRRGACSPLWCPCSGRLDLDVVPAGCCAHYNRPEDWKAANTEYEREKRARNA